MPSELPTSDYPDLSPLDKREKRKRKREWIMIASLALLFVLLTFAEFRLTKLSGTLPFVNSIFFFGLLNINLIILLSLVWLVFRNIGKLFLERRRRLLGSRLKTKLVIAFLAFSIIPTLVLFVISAMYINSSFDKWFSLKVQNTLQASLEITRTYYRNADETARHFATHLAGGVAGRLGTQKKLLNPYFPGRIPGIEGFLNEQRELLALDAVEFYTDVLEERYLAKRMDRPDRSIQYPRLSLDLLEKAFSGQDVSFIQHMGDGDLIRSVVPVKIAGETIGVLGVNSYIPVSLVNKVDEIASVFDDYQETNPLKYPMKTTYLVILIMITLVILFVAIWIGLYLARELTVPLSRLVRGAQAVGAGNLNVTINSDGHDEISVLVDSFNKMTSDLRENRGRLTQATDDLQKRTLQLEAVLTNVGTGVLVVDRQGVISTYNRAASHLLEKRPTEVIGKKISEAFGEGQDPLLGLVSKALESIESGDEAQSSTAQWNFQSGENVKSLTAIVTPLSETGDGAAWGVVVVIDDMTHLIKAQREKAWREVARRIAHEIKNPLTPIKLSAQRLQRRLGKMPDIEGEFLNECTSTIIHHTDALKEMVNEFSNFARFPEVSPARSDLHSAILEVVSLFRQAHPDLQIHMKTDPEMPFFDFDKEQFKRVILNLLDNAVSALIADIQNSEKKVEIETRFNSDLQLAVIHLKDNGPGISEDLKARVFEPYFSTKKEGTGLGLAIAKRIVNDHDGVIRVQSAPGQGTQFTIELPTSVRHENSGRA